MTPTRQSQPAAAGPQKIVCHRRPVAPCEVLPHGLDGLVSIGTQDYLIAYHAELPEAGEPVIHGYRVFCVQTASSYDISADLLDCECGDCTWRKRKCKHISALEQLREQGDVA